MKNRICIALGTAAALALAGCSSTGARIRAHQVAFDSYPERVQYHLRRGVIEVGYTPEMVFIALGEPSRKAEVVAEDGTAQVWTWWKHTPGVSIGLGGWNHVGSHVGFGSGISVGDRGRRETKAVVEFRSDKVHRFEVLAPR